MTACCPEDSQPSDVPLAFEAFYAAQRGELRGYLLKRGAKHSDVDDVIQEAMYRTWLWHRGNLDIADADRVRAYLYTAAATKLIDVWRRNGSCSPRPHFDDIASDGIESPAAAAERAHKRRDLAAALSQLPPAERALLLDAEVYELDTEELVERYDTSDNALRQRRWRTRQRLRQQLDAWRLPVLPLALSRRKVAETLRSWSRSIHLMATELTPHAQAAVLIITAVSLVAGPFHGPLGPLPPAYADNGDQQRAPDDAAPTVIRTPADALDPLPGAHHVKPPSGVMRRSHLGDRIRRPRVVPPVPTPTELPRVCVVSPCPNQPGDVLIIHLPAPLGDREVRQDVVAACEWAPDSAVAECHTEGKPNYLVPLPPRP